VSRALLDVNVLLALFDADHVDHARAWAWLDDEIGHGWASCPITQNGFVRIISQPRYPNPISCAQAIGLLSDACATEHHEFWVCDLSILDGDLVRSDRVHGPRQVTDLYLLALAVRRGGRLVTFDDSVPLSAVAGAGDRHLDVL
jgi:toxin-antitoxin system PIN domain toxin